MYAAYSDGNGTALSALLGWQRVRKTQVCTPVTSSDGQNAQLGDDDGSTDSSCDFLRGLDTETNVSLRITNDNDSLESGTLTGTSLLLDGLDLQLIDSSVIRDSKYMPTILRISSRAAYLHNLILELGQEEVHNLVLLDGQRVQVDLLHRLDLSILDETAELGNWLPLLLLVLVGTTARSTTSASTASVTSVSSTVAARSKSTAASSSSASGCVSHIEFELIGNMRVNSESWALGR
jgi:hypothetical protein